MTSKKNAQLNVSIALTCLLLIGIFSCNNSDNTGQNSSIEAEKKDQSGQNQDEQNSSTTKAFLGDGKFAYLAIHKDSLEKFFITNPPQGLNSKKIVFRFSHDGNNTSSIKIDGFLTERNSVNFLNRPPVTLIDTCATNKSDLSGKKIYLSDLELTQKQYVDHIFPIIGNNKYLLLIPYIITSTGKAENHVTYRMFWISDCQTFAPPQIQIANFDENSDLNPCPPNQPGQ